MNDGEDILGVLDFFGAQYDLDRTLSWSDEIFVYCPFCGDRDSKKPAGRASMAKNVYYCFSCGAGGSPRTLMDRFTTIEVVR
jgi:hypothetical protein